MTRHPFSIGVSIFAIVVLLAAVAIAQTLLPRARVDGLTGDGWLAKALTAERTVTYTAGGRIRDGRTVATFTELHAADGAMRLTYTDPAHAGASVAARGNTLELCDVRGRTTRHDGGGGERCNTLAAGCGGALRARIIGLGWVAGRRTVELQVREGSDGAVVQRMALDRATAVPLRVRRVDARGRVRRETVYQTITYRPVSADDCLSAPPAAAALTLAQAETKARLHWIDPAWLPTGFTRVELRGIPCPCRCGGTALQATYRDGLRTLLVTEKARVMHMRHGRGGGQGCGSGGCSAARGQDAGVVTRTAGGRQIIVVGEMDSAVLTRIAESVPVGE